MQGRLSLTREKIPELAAALARCRWPSKAADELGLDPRIVRAWLRAGRQRPDGLQHELYVAAVEAGWNPANMRAPFGALRPRRLPSPLTDREKLEALLCALEAARRLAPAATTEDIIGGVLTAVNRGEVDLTEWVARRA